MLQSFGLSNENNQAVIRHAKLTHLAHDLIVLKRRALGAVKVQENQVDMMQLENSDCRTNRTLIPRLILVILFILFLTHLPTLHQPLDPCTYRSVKKLRSPPALKARPAPVNTTARSAGSVFSPSTTLTNSSPICSTKEQQRTATRSEIRCVASL